MTAYKPAMTQQPDSMDLIMGGYKDLVATEKEPLLFLFPSHSSFFMLHFLLHSPAGEILFRRFKRKGQLG